MRHAIGRGESGAGAGERMQDGVGRYCIRTIAGRCMGLQPGGRERLLIHKPFLYSGMKRN